MGRAIALGLLETGTVAVRNVIIYDIALDKREAAEQIGIAVADSAESLVTSSDVLLLAVKPQSMELALEEIRPAFKPATLVVSIAAGISIAYIQKSLGPETRVARVMPNTPALLRAGAAAISLSANCTDMDAAVARLIFEAIGIVEMVPEEAMDVVTALSGSGPAYFFYLAECLVDAAVSHGLPREQAARLAGQTLLGAGRLLVESGENAATLRKRVTSKGGTTEAALMQFRTEGLEAIVRAAVDAAVARSKELGQ